MKMESPETEIFRLGDDSERLVEQASVDAEFVFCQTCGDVVVGMGVDIGIHAQGYGARYDGISDTEKLTESIRLTPLASLGSLAYTDETANGALRRAAHDFEYHFDRQMLSLKSCIFKGERT